MQNKEAVSSTPSRDTQVGVGLRHAHYGDALASSATIDFVEIHTENFFARGGVSRSLLENIAATYPVSFHSTAMSLGSAQTVPDSYFKALLPLMEIAKPILLSDHASFSQGTYSGKPIHVGDLLPLKFSDDWLAALSHNVDRVQQRTGQRLLIENLSAYIELESSNMSEAEFLTRLSENTGCGLLLDLNNLIVNAHNQGINNVLPGTIKWLHSIPQKSVGEIHLAGFSKPLAGQPIIDDHSRPVSSDCWRLYETALQRFGAVPTLIEWDNDLPDWQRLLEEVDTAKAIARRVFNDQEAWPRFGESHVGEH